MNKLIIYGSHYGTTKSYAEKLSELTGIKAISHEDIKDLSAYKMIIHFGGLYAGGIKGIKDTIKAIDAETELIIVTVGLADPTNQENTQNIKETASRQVPKELYDKTRFFHLRGGIDYNKLSFIHKTMMKMVYSKVKSIPEDMLKEEDKGFIETYNKTVNFVDFNSLEPLVQVIS